VAPKSKTDTPGVIPSTTPFSKPLMLTLKEASEFSGIAVYSLRNLCRQGTIAYRRMSCGWMVNTSSLEKFAKGEKAA
jgi:hypothetical protein